MAVQPPTVRPGERLEPRVDAGARGLHRDVRRMQLDEEFAVVFAQIADHGNRGGKTGAVARPADDPVPESQHQERTRQGGRQGHDAEVVPVRRRDGGRRMAFARRRQREKRRERESHGGIG